MSISLQKEVLKILTQFTRVYNCLYEQASTVIALLTLQILGYDVFSISLNFSMN